MDASYDIVLLTIAGNDLGFANIAKYCFGNVHMDKCHHYLNVGEEFLKSADAKKNIKYRILETLIEVRKNMREDAILLYSSHVLQD